MFGFRGGFEGARAAFIMMESRPQVLIVDDVVENIQVLHAILQESYTTIFATSGKKALEVARAQLPDLILLDVRMPEMDGYEVCRDLRDDPRTENTPVIFVTSLDDVDDETRGFECGGVDYITKPVSPPIVKARIATHIKLKQQADDLRRLSRLDGLTGLANRRRFDELLQINWSRSGRTGSPLSIILLDVDFFKQYNDTFGHQKGDECLQQIAKVLGSSLKRMDDLAARYGGEEFICLLPHTSEEGAYEIAETLVSSVRSLNLAHESSKICQTVTISAGVATASEFQGIKAPSLVEIADQALYRAKEKGRNQVCSLKVSTGD